MPTFRRLTVEEILSARPGLQRVRLDDGSRAYALVDLVGEVAVGDPLIVNTTAVDLGLGTGGWHVVHWNLARDGLDAPGRGHIMKLRYTSLQADTGSLSEAGAPEVSDLRGMPVVICAVHSQVGVVATVARHLRPDARISYVMTDGAALPLALSDLVAELVASGAIDDTTTAGHAFGGDHEAVTAGEALLAAAGRGSDLAVVGMGPGVVGAGTALGTTAVEVAPLCDLVAALGGRAVLCLRASDGDERPRHRGVSHHSATALALARTQPDVFRPAGVDVEGGWPDSAVAVEVGDVVAILDAAGLRITTMGRDVSADPLFFATAAASAVGAVTLQ